MTHPHLILTFMDGSTTERCLADTGWRINDYTQSVVVGIGVPRTHYPLVSLKWFSLVSKPENCAD